MSVPPLEFLLEASLKSLQDLELTALNHSANLSKAIKRELEAWVEHEASAKLARWMLDNRDATFRESSLRVDIKPKKVEFLESGHQKKSA